MDFGPSRRLEFGSPEFDKTSEWFVLQVPSPLPCPLPLPPRRSPALVPVLAISGAVPCCAFALARAFLPRCAHMAVPCCTFSARSWSAPGLFADLLSWLQLFVPATHAAYTHTLLPCLPSTADASPAPSFPCPSPLYACACARVVAWQPAEVPCKVTYSIWSHAIFKTSCAYASIRRLSPVPPPAPALREGEWEREGEDDGDRNRDSE